MPKNLEKVENLQEVATTTNNVELSKAEIATEVRKQAEELIEHPQEVAAATNNVKLSKAEIATETRKQAEELIGHRARIVPAGTIDWIEGWVKTTQADLRPKTPCVLVVVEGDDGKLYRRTYGSKLLQVDLESEKRETKSRVHVPETLEELEEALKKAQAQLESATNKVNLLTRALEEAKKSTQE